VTRYLLDTDTFSLYLRHDVAVLAALTRHLTDPVAISVITVQELRNGWGAVISRAKTPDQVGEAYSRLTATLNELRNWPVVSFSSGAVQRYAALKKQKAECRGERPEDCSDRD
jgi:predicted nucleic acid-binding protein